MNSNLKGSCLCGKQAFEIEGDAGRFYHCHCQRCRKASGTGHASNILVQPATLTWHGNAEGRSTYKVPEAERFATNFCNHCGSPLPREYAVSGMVVVPAGSLDCEAPIKPQARIFQGSSATWSCSGELIPGFDEYPT